MFSKMASGVKASLQCWHRGQSWKWPTCPRHSEVSEALAPCGNLRIATWIIKTSREIVNDSWMDPDQEKPCGCLMWFYIYIFFMIFQTCLMAAQKAPHTEALAEDPMAGGDGCTSATHLGWPSFDMEIWLILYHYWDSLPISSPNIWPKLGQMFVFFEWGRANRFNPQESTANW